MVILQQFNLAPMPSTSVKIKTINYEKNFWFGNCIFGNPCL
jgi:hypothetical protein